MKKIYEVPAMEIVRLDASENIAKLPTLGEGSTSSTSINSGRVETKTQSSFLAAAISGWTASTQEEA